MSHQCDREHARLLNDLVLVVSAPRKTVTLTSENKAKAIAFLVEGDIHRLRDDPRVVFGSYGEIEASFEFLCHVSMLVEVPKARSRRTKRPVIESQQQLTSLYFTGRGGGGAGRSSSLPTPSPPRTVERTCPCSSGPYQSTGCSETGDRVRLASSYSSNF